MYKGNEHILKLKKSLWVYWDYFLSKLSNSDHSLTINKNIHCKMQYHITLELARISTIMNLN